MPNSKMRVTAAPAPAHSAEPRCTIAALLLARQWRLSLQCAIVKPIQHSLWSLFKFARTAGVKMKACVVI